MKSIVYVTVATFRPNASLQFLLPVPLMKLSLICSGTFAAYTDGSFLAYICRIPTLYVF